MFSNSTRCCHRHSSGPGPSAQGRVLSIRWWVDLDSTICEVHGKPREGAAYGYSKKLGYLPLLAAIASTRGIVLSPLGKRARFSPSRVLAGAFPTQRPTNPSAVPAIAIHCFDGFLVHSCVGPPG